ncbi:MAG: hypothetical protein JXQ66_01655 [Campylobacterales bacterium]|nr:hypothetical protein [Campylobacterales bacterium]
MRTRQVRNGMRSGISIVEMMVAVFLFGVISTIGYKYAKNYYNVSLAGKQTLVAAIVDQATQLSNAYELYETKTGSAPASVAALSADNVQILKETPPAISTLSSGWTLNKTLEIDGDGNGDDFAFLYPIDVPVTDAEKLEYCNILNNMIDSEWDFDSTYNAVNNVATEEVNDAEGMYAKSTNKFKHIMCYADDSSTMFFAFVQQLN